MNEYINENRISEWMTKAIHCKDGLTISVQGSNLHYSCPKNSKGPWTHVKCGFPSRKVEELMLWASDGENPIETVYSYVPVEVVERVIKAIERRVTI